jgi:hypothetical protein
MQVDADDIRSIGPKLGQIHTFSVFFGPWKGTAVSRLKRGNLWSVKVDEKGSGQIKRITMKELDKYRLDIIRKVKDVASKYFNMPTEKVLVMVNIEK